MFGGETSSPRREVRQTAVLSKRQEVCAMQGVCVSPDQLVVADPNCQRQSDLSPEHA